MKQGGAYGSNYRELQPACFAALSTTKKKARTLQINGLQVNVLTQAYR